MLNWFCLGCCRAAIHSTAAVKSFPLVNLFTTNGMIFGPSAIRASNSGPGARVSEFGESFLLTHVFGPFPPKIRDLVNEDTYQLVIYIMHLNPPEIMTPFSMVRKRDIVKEDKEFILRIMKMDWRDRPTAKELLEDE